MSRVIDFFDGAQSETAPVIGNIAASNLVKYASPADVLVETVDQATLTANDAVFETVSPGGFSASGNGYLANNSGNVTSVKARIRKSSGATGLLTAKIFSAISNSTPDTLIATSDSVNLSTVAETFSLITFNFSTPGAQIAAGKYVVVIEGNGITLGSIQIAYSTIQPVFSNDERTVSRLPGDIWTFSSGNDVNLVIEVNVGALAPAPNQDENYELNEQGAPQKGNIYYNTTLDVVRYYNGTKWQSLVDETTVQVLENKEIDGSTAGNNIVLTVASNVEVTPLGNLTSTDAESALNELQGDIDGHETRLDQHDLDITDLQTNKENKSEKGQPNGYCELDGSGLVPSIRLPSYVDDVLSYVNFAAFPVTGESGKIYIDESTNNQFRWSGSIYVQLAASPVNSVNGQTGVVVLNVDDLNDVVAPTPLDNDVLTYDTGTSKWINQSVPRNLDDLGNVNAPSPANGDVLKYNTGTSQWESATETGGSVALNDLTDVVITSPQSGDLLEYNGTNWVNVVAPNTASFSAYRSANQTGVNTNNSSVQIIFNQEFFDLGGNFDSVSLGAFVCTAQGAGKWIFTASIAPLNTNILAGRYQTRIFLNGVAIALGHNPAHAAGVSEILQVTSRVVQLVEGDIVDVRFFGAPNNSASTLTISSDAAGTYFTGYKVGR